MTGQLVAAMSVRADGGEGGRTSTGTDSQGKRIRPSSAQHGDDGWIGNSRGPSRRPRSLHTRHAIPLHETRFKRSSDRHGETRDGKFLVEGVGRRHGAEHRSPELPGGPRRNESVSTERRTRGGDSGVSCSAIRVDTGRSRATSMRSEGEFVADVWACTNAAVNQGKNRATRSSDKGRRGVAPDRDAFYGRTGRQVGGRYGPRRSGRSRPASILAPRGRIVGPSCWRSSNGGLLDDAIRPRWRRRRCPHPELAIAGSRLSSRARHVRMDQPRRRNIPP